MNPTLIELDSALRSEPGRRLLAERFGVRRLDRVALQRRAGDAWCALAEGRDGPLALRLPRPSDAASLEAIDPGSDEALPGRGLIGAGARLEAALGPLRIQVRNLRIRRYRPASGLLAQATVDGESHPRSLYVRLRTRAAHEALREGTAALPDPPPGLALARPALWLDDAAATATWALDGRRLVEALKKGAPAAPDVVADAVRAFHRLPAWSGRRRLTVDAERRRTLGLLRQLSPVAPSLADLAARLAEPFDLPPSRDVTLHGDLHPGQIVLGDVVGLLDLDTAGTGHPWLDVIHLGEQLWLRGLRYPEREAGIGHLRAALYAAFGVDPNGFAARRLMALRRARLAALWARRPFAREIVPRIAQGAADLVRS